MARRKLQPESAGPAAIDHDPPIIPAGFATFTAWHHFLARALAKTRVPGFEIDCFVKLGALPLEADVIILHLDPTAEIQEFRRYFDFLVPALRRCVVLEYKSPDDRLTLPDFDTVRAYAMLAKRNYDVAGDEDVAIVMMYSHTEVGFFAGCERNGFPFTTVRPGVRASRQLPLALYAVDLVKVGQQQPAHPINLLSARRRSYGKAGFSSGLGPFGVLYEAVFHEELKKMSQQHVRGTKDLFDDGGRTIALITSQLSVEDRLRGLGPEDRLRGLSREERARLRELLLKPEDQ